jgi:N-acetylmuramoyl-L-alanine amidase
VYIEHRVRIGFLSGDHLEPSENSDLKKTRKDPNVLFPGDVVFVPEKELRVEARSTDARHRFQRKGVPEFLSLRFLDEEEPRAGEEYAVTIDGSFGPSGKLDADGACLLPIPPGSKSAILTLGDPSRNEKYPLSLGGLDPIEEISGVAQRLFNLGYLETAPSVGDCPELSDAVKAFQIYYKLPAENGLDDATRQKLKEVHGA